MMIHRLQKIVLWLPIILSGLWSSKPALFGLLAARQFPKIVISEEEYQDRSSFSVKMSRRVQQHFRGFGIHIPLEDILLRPFEPSYQERLFLLLDRSCGNGKVYVWIPLVFRFPFAGNKVLEWCWIPSIKTEKN